MVEEVYGPVAAASRARELFQDPLIFGGMGKALRLLTLWRSGARYNELPALQGKRVSCAVLRYAGLEGLWCQCPSCMGWGSSSWLHIGLVPCSAPSVLRASCARLTPETPAPPTMTHPPPACCAVRPVDQHGGAGC